jgi:ABC-2 type transport system ATP-binding protein
VSILTAEGLRFAVRKHFWMHKTPILRDVSLAVEAGEIFGFLGPNGAGKTTTIKALLGLITLDTGVVRILGKPPRDTAMRSHIGYLPENAYFPDYLTPRELVAKHGQLARLSRAEAHRRAGEVIELVGLTAAAEQRLGTFSKGMLQRAGLAQALVAEPEVVVLDEPMSGLDPLGRRDIREIMLALRSAGKTVFFSTHILPDVERVCDRVGIIVNGSSRRVGRLDALLGSAISQAEVTTGPVDAGTREAAATLVTGIEVGPTSTVFRAASLERANALIDLLRGRSVTVRDLQTRSHSLEDLFVQEAESDA